MRSARGDMRDHIVFALTWFVLEAKCYLRKYDGIGLEEFTGQALFAGPTAYLLLSERSRRTIAWTVQAWGRATGSTAALDLVNFERHQPRLIFGFNF